MDEGELTGDGIGDACELVTNVILANPSCTSGMIPVTVPESFVTSVSADFTVAGCNPGDAQCSLDCSAIQYSQP
jgi:hypothetical protein